MTVITMVTDPATDKQIPKAKGIIKRINIKPINADGSPKITNINKGPNAGKTIKATHRYSVLLEVGGDAVWISFGDGEVKNEKYADQFQIKVGDAYKNLLPGMEISVYPVDTRKWDKGGVEQTAYEAKKKNINLLNEAGAIQPSAKPAATEKAAPANTAGGTKIFGEILSIDNGIAQVKDEKIGQGGVILGDHAAEVSVGGRLGAVVDAAGNILSGFKAYGPAGANKPSGASGGASAGGKGTFKKDNSGMEIGHAINGALNIRRKGYKLATTDLAKLVHDLSHQLKEEARADENNKGISDYDLGASIGHAVLNATRDIVFKKEDDIVVVAEKLKTYTLGLLSKVVPDVTAYVKAGGAAGIAAAEAKEQAEAAAKLKAEQDAQAAAEAGNQPEPQAQTPSNHVDMCQPPMDFDDDIPF